MSEVFRAYDVRGKYPKDIDEGVAFRVGAAFGKFIEGDTVTVGMDARDSSSSLKKSVIQGLCSSDKKVIDIGLCTTPMEYFSVRHLDADGGIMITASHNPREYNGIKMVRNSDGDILQVGEGLGMERVKKLFRDVEGLGHGNDFKEREILEDYVEYLLDKLVEKSGLKIVVDYGNGVGSIPGKALFEKTDFEVSGLFEKPMSDFPNHAPNPHEKDNFEILVKEVREQGADMGIFFDGDADRAIPVDEKGNILDGDTLLGILATRKLKKEGCGTVYHDLRATKALKERIESLGGEAVEMRVGNPYYKMRLSSEGGLIAGELSGHIMYKENGCVDDGLYAMVKLINIMLESGKPLSELCKPFKKYYKTDEINIEVEDKPGKIDEIEEIYSDRGARISKLDGITVEFDNWWFNLRPSNTEDLMRLNLEASTEDLMKEKRREVEDIIRNG